MISRAFLLRALPSKLRETAPVLNALGRVISTACHLTDDQLEFQRTARDFARKELLPHASHWDETKHFPVDTLRAAARLGFGGLYIREDVGGSALGRADAAVIFEELAYGDISTSAYLTIHNMVSHCIDRYGTEEQRHRFLPQLVAMDKLASYCLTEPNSGSDAASLTTSAKLHGSSYILSGSKAFISGGGASDVYLIMARTGGPGPKDISAFLVEKGTPGLSFGKQEAKTGWNAQPTCTVILDAVRVPAENLLGREGQGFSIAMNALDGGRINIGACSLGGAAFCMDAAQTHAAVRKQFGQAIGSFQAIQFKLADMATSLHSARLMVRHAAESMDCQLSSGTLDAAMAKRYATDACCKIADDAMQVFGGYGYLKEYKVERVWRDLRVHRLLEGTNEVMNIIIARELAKQ